MPNNSLLESHLPITSFGGKKVMCSSQACRYLHTSAHISVCMTRPPPDFNSLMLDLFWVSAVWIVKGMNRISERHSSGIVVWAKLTHAFPRSKNPNQQPPNNKQLRQHFNKHLQSNRQGQHWTAWGDEREEYRDIICCYRPRWHVLILDYRRTVFFKICCKNKKSKLYQGAINSSLILLVEEWEESPQK